MAFFGLAQDSGQLVTIVPFFWSIPAMSQSEGKKSSGRASAEAAASARPKERRKRNIPVAKERRNQKGQGPKPPPQPGELSFDEVEFMKAMDQYKRDNRRPFPTWSEVLEVLRALGYRKVHSPAELPRFGSPPVSPKG
ncbi:MAG TPA: hypothetical protein VGZ47_03085 [Gemmataceae bacterium]|jgi:hypothetical protein|nr:hypothetical protein [Gemmataceae bacterium]